MNDNTQRTEKEIQTDISTARERHAGIATVLNKAREEWEKLEDELKSTRVAKFDQSVVAEAQKWGINPHNFESEDLLKEAIAKVQGERQLAEPEIQEAENVPTV
jgi:predicted mannosyl-3-phosphoglycerate phosphatase (HAD superfamily)